MAIGVDIAVEKAPRRSKERLGKYQRKARKQLPKWTHIGGAVRSESAYVDLDFGTTSSINGTALQVGCPAPGHAAKFGIVLLSENAWIDMKSGANESSDLRSPVAPRFIVI